MNTVRSAAPAIHKSEVRFIVPPHMRVEARSAQCSLVAMSLQQCGRDSGRLRLPGVPSEFLTEPNAWRVRTPRAALAARQAERSTAIPVTLHDRANG
jgi:hypothetical protein